MLVHALSNCPNCTTYTKYDVFDVNEQASSATIQSYFLYSKLNYVLLKNYKFGNAMPLFFGKPLSIS